MNGKIQERNIAVAVILSLVTCGIYAAYWTYCVGEEVKSLTKDESLPSGVALILLTLVTCGIYTLFWYYKVGSGMKSALEKNGQAGNDNSVLYLILGIFGFGIINLALIQSDLNKIATSSITQVPPTSTAA